MIQVAHHPDDAGDETAPARGVELASHVVLEPLPVQTTGAGKPLAEGKLQLIGDVKIKLRAVVGDAEISVEELFALKEGATLRLDTPVNAPIDLYFDDKLVARGELVVVDENFGVSITSIEA